MNPYEPPKSDEPEFTQRPKQRRIVPSTVLRSIVIPTVVGGAIGSALFASGRPASYGISFAGYGMLSLVTAIAGRLFRRYFRV